MSGVCGGGRLAQADGSAVAEQEPGERLQTEKTAGISADRCGPMEVARCGKAVGGRLWWILGCRGCIMRQLLAGYSVSASCLGAGDADCSGVRRRKHSSPVRERVRWLHARFQYVAGGSPDAVVFVSGFSGGVCRRLSENAVASRLSGKSGSADRRKQGMYLPDSRGRGVLLLSGRLR